MSCRLPPNGNAIYDITMIGGKHSRQILPKHIAFMFNTYIEHPNLFESLHPDHPYSQFLMLIKRENA